MADPKSLKQVIADVLETLPADNSLTDYEGWRDAALKTGEPAALTALQHIVDTNQANMKLVRNEAGKHDLKIGRKV